jgi:nucleoside-diphosphate-sugar epimerase
MYAGTRVLVTGGLGFVGSNLAIRLVERGALVTIVDSSVPGCGANPFNIAPVKDRVRVIEADISDAAQFEDEIRAADVIFNIAGEISHPESMRYPERDLRLNTVAHLRFLLVCRAAHPGVRIVYASTRQIYGRARYLPVDEEHPANPVDFNGIHKRASTQYHLLLSRLGELDAIVLRLTNVYGPRAALNLPHQGFLSTFIRAALLAQPLTVYGDGSSVRDPIYIDDAVEAFLLAGSARVCQSRVYNVGGPETLPVRALAEAVTAIARNPLVVYTPFPVGRESIDVGAFAASSDRIRRELGWSARTRFCDGIRQTLSYYEKHLNAYLRPVESHLELAAQAV